MTTSLPISFLPTVVNWLAFQPENQEVVGSIPTATNIFSIKILALFCFSGKVFLALLIFVVLLQFQRTNGELLVLFWNSHGTSTGHALHRSSGR